MMGILQVFWHEGFTVGLGGDWGGGGGQIPGRVKVPAGQAFDAELHMLDEACSKDISENPANP